MYDHQHSLVGTAYVGDSYYLSGVDFRIGPVRVWGGVISRDQQNPEGSHQVTINGFGGLTWLIKPDIVLRPATIRPPSRMTRTAATVSR